MKTCLIVIDVQESFRHRPFFTEHDLPAYLQAQNALIDGCVAQGIPVVRVFHSDGPEVAENPDALVVYGGIGKAARNWDCFEAILKSLRELREDETLLVQSGKPVGVFRTHVDAPRVLIANSNLVPKWATWEHFHELDRKGLMMYGQMTAGSWIYIGTQGIVQGRQAFLEERVELR